MDKAQHVEPPVASENEENCIVMTAIDPDLQVNPAEAPMDGGRDAWLAVVGCWMLIFNSWFAQPLTSRRY